MEAVSSDSICNLIFILCHNCILQADFFFFFFFRKPRSVSMYLRGNDLHAMLRFCLAFFNVFFLPHLWTVDARQVCTVRRNKCNSSSLPASSWNRLTVCKDPVLFWRLGREKEEHFYIFKELWVMNLWK